MSPTSSPKSPPATANSSHSPSALRSILGLARLCFGQLLFSPIALVAIPIFLVVCGVQLFVVAPFFEADQATLRPLFDRIPLLFILYIPAVSMRLISEERRSGTLEVLVTLPITDAQIIAGKFLGALLFIATTLAITLVFPLIVGGLGALDIGVVITSYLGLLLVGAAYLALGLLTSVWTQNQVVAYLLAALFCGFFFGIDTMVGSIWAPGRDAFAFLSVRVHFAPFVRGVIDSRDVLFFGSVCAVALVAATQSLTARHWR